MMKVHLICLFAIVLQSFILGSNGCTISVNTEITDPQPLILRTRGLGNAAFYKPDNKGTINVDTNEELYLACPGASLSLNGTTISKAAALAQCVSGTRFKIAAKTIDFKLITCTKQITQIVRYTGNACLEDYREIEMGFHVDDGRFVRLMLGCFDADEQNAIYSQYELTRAIGGYQANYGRVDFKEGAGFYSLGKTKVDDLYNRNTQRVNVNGQLGLAADDLTYISATDDFYLARGHLTAKTDFLYGVQQRLTFYFVNAAPQWQTLNAGNWLTLENNVRDYASKQNVTLVVYTGTFGRCTLPHGDTEEEVELWLYDDDDDDVQAIPVPEIYWKVVYNEETQKGTTFIAVNNPYWTDYEVYCDDVCDQVDWVKWRADDQKSGFAYCCDVNEFRSALNVLPNFPVKGLLV